MGFDVNSRTDENTLVKRIHKHDKVSTTNDLVSASYNIDLQLEKMILFAISVVNKFELDNKTNFDFKMPVVVSAENMANLTWDYDEKVILTPEESRLKLERVRSITRSMKRFYTDLKTLPVMEVLRDEKGLSEKIPMISKLGFDAKKRQLLIYFPKEFYEFFYKLTGEAGVKPFNRHEIKYIMKMDYYFSLRLYRFLNAQIWRSNKQPIILEYQQIRRMLDKDQGYSTHQKIKEKLVDPAVEEINKYTNFKMTATYLKSGSKYTAVRLDYDYKPEYVERKISKQLEQMKIKYLKAAVPWSDDGSHFKDPDRYKFFKAPKKLTKRQVEALVNQPVFLNDYGKFIGTLEEDVAKVVMRTLLTNKLEVLNTFKPIDLDYYLQWLRIKNSPQESIMDDDGIEAPAD